ncbi:hypothetical protein MKEN_00993500 [Mycena kentingensis (nom. inval.)]|nr:hypothetical protein MKEN_00993500 [Mycena kentingensis (nom. inval.)]
MVLYTPANRIQRGLSESNDHFLVSVYRLAANEEYHALVRWSASGRTLIVARDPGLASFEAQLASYGFRRNKKREENARTEKWAHPVLKRGYPTDRMKLLTPVSASSLKENVVSDGKKTRQEKTLEEKLAFLQKLYRIPTEHKNRRAVRETKRGRIAVVDREQLPAILVKYFGDASVEKFEETLMQYGFRKKEIAYVGRETPMVTWCHSTYDWEYGLAQKSRVEEEDSEPNISPTVPPLNPNKAVETSQPEKVVDVVPKPVEPGTNCAHCDATVAAQGSEFVLEGKLYCQSCGLLVLAHGVDCLQVPKSSIRA